MAKTASERQRERRKKLKENGKYEQYKVKASQQKTALRRKKKAVETEKEKKIRQEKDRINHQKYRLKKKGAKKIVSPCKAFGSKQAMGKAVSRARKSLPHSPRKRTLVVQKLAIQYSPVVPCKTKRISSSAIDETIKETVESFYTSDGISSQAPGLKEFCIIRNETGKMKIQKRYLQLTISEAHQLFKKDYPLLKVGFSKFASLRPKHVYLRSDTPNNMCLCIYHENVQLLLASSVLLPNTSTELVKLIVCNDEKKECMLQTCNECKDLQLYKSFVENFDEDQLELEVSYKQWIKSDAEILVRSKHKGLLNDILSMLEKQLKKFLWHVYVKRIQAKAFKNLKKNLPYGTLLIQTDFSENFCHTYQDEIQSAHWQNTSSTLYTTMVYYRQNENATEVSADPYVVISDYLHHDKYAVIVYNKAVIESFMEQHPEFKLMRLEFQSDGTAQHFKQKYTLYSMTTNKLPTVWHFSATSHGKGCIDGLGGTIKRSVRDATRARNIDPRTSAEFASDAKTYCPGINILYTSEQSILKVKDNLDKTWTFENDEIKGMPATRSAHCFRSRSHGKVWYSLTSECDKGTEFDFKTGKCVTECEIDSTVTVLTNPDVYLQCGQWVTVMYDNQKFHGVIIEIAKEQFKIKCLEQTTSGQYKFESDNNAVWYKREEIIASASAPSLMNSRGFYKL